MHKFLFVSVLAIVLLIGCGGPGPTVKSEGGLDLVGTRWLAEDIDGRGVIDMLQSTISFETNTQAQASGGCNNAFGNVQINGNQLEFGAFGTTLRMCSTAISDQESKFFSALGRTRSYRLDSETDLLYFMDADSSEILRFSRMAPVSKDAAQE